MSQSNKTSWFKPRPMTESELKKNFWGAVIIGFLFPPAFLLALYLWVKWRKHTRKLSHE